MVAIILTARAGIPARAHDNMSMLSSCTHPPKSTQSQLLSSMRNDLTSCSQGPRGLTRASGIFSQVASEEQQVQGHVRKYWCPGGCHLSPLQVKSAPHGGKIAAASLHSRTVLTNKIIMLAPYGILYFLVATLIKRNRRYQFW